MKTQNENPKQNKTHAESENSVFSANTGQKKILRKQNDLTKVFLDALREIEIAKNALETALEKLNEIAGFYKIEG